MSSADDRTISEDGWTDHNEQQLRRLARLTLAEKLKWLEEADHIVRSLSNGHSAVDFDARRRSKEEG